MIIRSKEDETKRHLEGYFIESQTNLQMINKNPDKFKEIAEIIARESVYLRIIYFGFDTLRKEPEESFKISHEANFNFLKPEIIDEIVNKEKALKEELLEKYDKLPESEKYKNPVEEVQIDETTKRYRI